MFVYLHNAILKCFAGVDGGIVAGFGGDVKAFIPFFAGRLSLFLTYRFSIFSY